MDNTGKNEDLYDYELDLSFTSCSSTPTTTTKYSTSSSSARSSLARSSLNVSFNESRLSCSSSSIHPRPHRRSDPHWSAIKAATALSSDGTLHLRHLKLQRHLGSGNLGRVFLCNLRDYEHASFALKVIDKNSLTTSKKVSHVQTEARILSSLDHPFLPTLYAHLEVSHYTCFLIDYCNNGDLHSLLRKQPQFRLPINAVRFYAAEVIVALEYLHANGIVYRDLKPENILIREDGHIMLSDFDLCFNADVFPRLETREHPRRKGGVEMEFVSEPVTAFSKSCVGTHEYLAPELVSGAGHGNGVDWWALGVLIYELLFGRTPFKGGSKESTLCNIASTRGVRFRQDEMDVRGMKEVKDLISKLLVKDPRRRLGCARGATDIKRHPFFDGIKWPLIRMYRPPDVRGVTVTRRGRSHAGHVTGFSSSPSSSSSPLTSFSPRRRRSWWKGLAYYLLKVKGSRRNLNANQNYYCYSNKIRKHV